MLPLQYFAQTRVVAVFTSHACGFVKIERLPINLGQDRMISDQRARGYRCEHRR